MKSSAEPMDRANQIARSATLLASLSGAALVLTILWNLSVASLFGTSAELDAYWIAQALPRAVADSFHYGLLTFLFIAIFAFPDETSDEDERWRLASAVVNIVLLATALVIVVLVASAPLLVRLMGPGLDPGARDLSAWMLQTLSAMLIPTALTGALAGVLNARQNFVYFGLLRVISLALQIAGLYLLVRPLGSGALVASTLLGPWGLLALSVIWRERASFRYSATLAFRGAHARAVLTMLAAMAGIAFLTRLNQTCARLFASLLEPGSVSALEFAWRFELPVSHIVSISVALPSFAIIALHPPRQRMAEMRHTLAISLRLIAFLVLPTIGLLVLLRHPLPLIWFRRGAFSSESAELISTLIPYLAAIFLCNAIATVIVFSLLAVGRARVVLGILVVEIVVNAVLSIALVGPLGLRGVVLAGAISAAASNVWLWMTIAREIGGWSPRTAVVQGWKTILVNALTLGLVGTVVHVLEGWSFFDPGPTLALKAGAVATLFFLIYAKLCHSLGLIEVWRDRGRPRVRLNPREWNALSSAK